MSRKPLRGQRELWDDLLRCPKCYAPTRRRRVEGRILHECLICPWTTVGEVSKVEPTRDRRS